MSRKQRNRFGLLLTPAIVLAASVTAALAGPPLLCHPLEIGDAESLPGNGSDWRVYKTEYDVENLVEDTLSLLTPGTPVIVRMETLRRATLHGKKDPQVLGQLLEGLNARVAGAEEAGRPDELAVFDAGYLTATINQFSKGFRTHVRGMGRDGYALVELAIELAGYDPEMEFAAALISVYPRRAGHEQHLQTAVAGGRDGSLLARNLANQFGE